MAPLQGSRSDHGTSEGRRSDGVDSVQSGSQSSGEDKVSKLAETMRRKVRSRRAKRHRDISNAFKNTMKEMEVSMQLKFDELMNEMTSRHRRRLERLKDLTRKRTAIEARMLVSIKNIENAFSFADKALSSTLGRRIQGLAV